MHNIEYLKQIPLFSGLSEEEIGEISSYIERKRFRKRECIFSEGDQSNWFYILVDGKVKITKLSHDGKEIIIELISPGDLFGGFAVLKGFPYPANAVAMEDCDAGPDIASQPYGHYRALPSFYVRYHGQFRREGRRLIPTL